MWRGGRSNTSATSIVFASRMAPLAVLDTFEFLEAGTYTVGSVWHSEEVSGMTSSSVAGR